MKTNSTTRPARGFVFIAISAILFGSLGVATQFVFAGAPTNAYSVTLLRALIALPFLILLSIFFVGKKFFALARRDLYVMIFAGLLMAMYQVSFVIALRMVNVTIATLITLCTVPVFAALLSAPLLGERVHRNIYFAMGIAIVGVVLLVGFEPVDDFGANAWLGIGLALLTALGSALNYIVVVDGQVVGTWRRTLSRAAVSLEFNLFTLLTERQSQAVALSAQRYGEFLELPVTLG